VLALHVTIWPAPARLRPLRVARQPRSVRDSTVSSERAVRLISTGTFSTAAADRSTTAGDRLATPSTSPDSLPLRFDDVFRRYASYVGALVLRLVGRPADVDDVVQDVFIQAHRDLARLRDPASLRPWLRRITVRRARRWLRKRWVRRRDRETDVDAHTDLVDAGASPEERAEIARIYRMLDRMPRDERLVWVLRFVEGETLDSIAELLGASVSTVQRRLRAAEVTMETTMGATRGSTRGAIG
jgi:RNA polymerase sigma-70 factor, ECF subfamily